MSVDVLAEVCEVNPDALERVLRLLTSYDFFDRRPDGYGHTPPSRLLRDDHPMSMRPFPQMMGMPFIRCSVTELGQAVRTGRPALDTLEPKGMWVYLQGHPSEAEVFGRAMTAKAGADVIAVLDAYDFSRFTTIADIGGGRYLWPGGAPLRGLSYRAQRRRASSGQGNSRLAWAA